MLQTSFNFPFLDKYLDDDFLLSNENRKAYNFVNYYNAVDDSIPKIFVIYGKKYCGKSHLCHIWKRKLDAEILNINNLKDFELANSLEEGKAYIIENIQDIENHIALFHIFNIAVEKNCFLMMTSIPNPYYLDFDFADLGSRLKNIFSIEIKDPEIEFIKMLFVKQFAIRQLMVDSKVIDYLAKNIDRNYDQVIQVSKLLEFYCFEQKRKITIPFVSDVLQKIIRK